MNQFTQDQRAVLQAAGWTEVEATAFRQAIATFRAGLPPRQQEAFNAILATASGAVGGAEVQGYLVVISLISVLIPPVAPRK